MTRCGPARILVLLALLSSAAACHRDDATLTAAVQSRVNRSVTPDSNVEVQVHDGVATLSGLVPSEQVKAKAVIAAKEIEGVKQVEDRLRVESPSSPSASH